MRTFSSPDPWPFQADGVPRPEFPPQKPGQPRRDLFSTDRDAIQRAVFAKACHGGLTAAELKVFMACSDRTLTWRKLSDRVSVGGNDPGLLQRISGVARPGRVLPRLVEAGLLAHYSPGTGRGLSTIVIAVPADWREYAAGTPTPRVDDAVHPEGTSPSTLRGSDDPPSVDEIAAEGGLGDPPSLDGVVLPRRTVSSAEPRGLTTTALHEGEPTSGAHEGGAALALALAPLPVAAEAIRAAILAEAPAAFGCPMPQKLGAAIDGALASGLPPRAVAGGVGAWWEEGFQHPPQLARFCGQVAAAEAPEIAHATTIRGLLAAGRDVQRRRGRRPDKFDKREATRQALRAWASEGEASEA